MSNLIGTDSGVAVAPQVSKGAPVALGDSKWRWQLARSISLQPVQNQEFLEQEIGGSYLSGGLYKTGYYSGGQIPQYLRSDDDQMHWLLYSLASTHQSQELVLNTAYENFYGFGEDAAFTPPSAPAAGDPFDYTDATMIASGGGRNRAARYITAKQILPAPENSDPRGEVLEDMRVNQLVVGAGKGALECGVGLIGGESTFYDAATGANWTASGFAADNSALVGCRGELNIGDTNVDISSAQSIQINISPNLTNPEDEQGMFSYTPDGFQTTSWSVTFQIAFNLQDWNAYSLARYNQADAGGGTHIWTPVPWVGDEPFWVEFLTPGAIHGSYPGSFGVWGNRVAWAMAPITRSPGQIVGAMLAGRVIRKTTTGVEWFIRTVNGVAGAAWPT